MTTTVHLSLPEPTRRLFPHHHPDRLTTEFLVERLLEDGDRADLTWLVSIVGEAAIRDRFEAIGGRRLSRRSRRFWSLVFSTSPSTESANEIWPF